MREMGKKLQKKSHWSWLKSVKIEVPVTQVIAVAICHGKYSSTR
jgi:hypothetical protein